MPGDLTDLIAWKEAAALAAVVVRLAPRVRGPQPISVRDQLVRAAESIPANIAEGYGRGRSADGVRFLRVARGSAVELESHLRVAILAGRITAMEGEGLVERTRRVRALLGGLMRVHNRP